MLFEINAAEKYQNLGDDGPPSAFNIIEESPHEKSSIHMLSDKKSYINSRRPSDVGP